MSSFVDNEALVEDLFERAGENGKLEETVIFCDLIKSTDVLAKIMDKKSGIDGYALAFHSKNDSNDAISKLRDKNDPCKVILSIGKLNEGIDLPKVKNVVFWRGTDSETIFFQQFGRGLRGDDLVRYFDYVGGIKNFAWINDIFVKYNKEYDKINNNKGGNNKLRKKKLSLLGGVTSVNKNNVNLFDIGFDILNIKNEFNIGKEKLIEYFKNIKENEEKSYKYLIGFSTQDIKDIKYKGRGIIHIFNLSGWKNPKGVNVHSPTGFIAWINWLFDKENSLEKYFKNYEGKTEEESYKYLIKMTIKDIKTIKYQGRCLGGITTLSGWKKPKGISVYTPSIFRKWVNWFFDMEEENLTKEGIVIYFKNYEGRTEEESYKYFMLLNISGTSKIRYKGKAIVGIVTFSGWEKPKGLKIQTSGGFKQWINWLFDKETPNKQD